MTHELFLTDPILSEQVTLVERVGEDERGYFCVLKETIFYPQGGGQPCDQGVLAWEGASASILHVGRKEGEIRHTLDQPVTAGTRVLLRLDQARRALHSRLHTAAHWLTHRVETLYPHLRATKAHAFPGESYLECEGTLCAEEVDLASLLSPEELPIVAFNLTVEKFKAMYGSLRSSLPDPSRCFRVVQIGDYIPIPCGGTHVAHTSEMGRITVRKITSKRGKTKFAFDLS